MYPLWPYYLVAVFLHLCENIELTRAGYVHMVWLLVHGVEEGVGKARVKLLLVLHCLGLPGLFCRKPLFSCTHGLDHVSSPCHFVFKLLELFLVRLGYLFIAAQFAGTYQTLQIFNCLPKGFGKQ